MSDVTKMMQTLEEYSAEIIIISDSNSIFISELLEAANLAKYIKKVFTNPASFEEVTRKRLIRIRIWIIRFYFSNIPISHIS